MNLLSTFTFLWLHQQSFYKTLQKQAIHSLSPATPDKIWADVGCSTGLMTRLASTLHYHVTGYDINTFSLFIAKILSFRHPNTTYRKKDFLLLDKTFDIITATSLLSVVDNKQEAINKLISLLKDDSSLLILIEPTEQMTQKNVEKKIHNFQSWWHYKGLILWAKAREGKSIDIKVFDNLNNVTTSHQYLLDGMVRVSYIQKQL